jgi:glycosyltransferase involved in cell wall biosynthesis
VRDRQPDDPPVRLSVVIPTRNGARTLGRQLERLADQEWSEPWEIVVADNGSTDGTAALVERFRERMPNLRRVDAWQQRGINYARNAGANAARGDLLAFCDDDDEVGPGWVAEMGSALARHEFVGGRLDSDALNEPWTVAVRGRPQGDGLVPFDGQPSYTIGCNFGVRRAVHERIGGFDETFIGGSEDADYSWRAQRAGATLHFEPRAVVAYRLKPTLRATFRQARSYGVGYVSLYTKHRVHGLPEPKRVWLYGALSWAGILRHLPWSASKIAVGRFLWQLGWKLGMLEGSIRNRVVLLSARGLPTPRTAPYEG